MNNSPWLINLPHRDHPRLSQSIETDACIIGGGIAGVSTAFFMLKHTDKQVVLIEAGDIAHGATGHNAGQITSYFEIPFTDMVAEFGLEQAAHAQRHIEEDARMLLEEMIIESGAAVASSQFVGYDGRTKDFHIFQDLEDLYYKREAGLTIRQLLIKDSLVDQLSIDSKYDGLYRSASQEDILSLLETKDPQYIAALPFLSGCMNSALFSMQILSYLETAFKDRFRVYTKSPIEKIELYQNYGIAYASHARITAHAIVLCTNGFESFSMQNKAGKDIDKNFHEEVFGTVGYMSAYISDLEQPPFAGIYSHKRETEDDPYTYVTRRQFTDSAETHKNLVCIGGPEIVLPQKASYAETLSYPERYKDELATFALQNTGFAKANMDFYWHGLMGYTKSRMRIVGKDLINPVLAYNLGCNGVGILTSIYGGYKLAKITAGESFAASAFDPR